MDHAQGTTTRGGRFRRGLIIFLIGGFVGTGLGVALGFFLFPFVFPPPPATEKLSDAERSQLLARGTFVHANPSDPIHWGRGQVSLHAKAVFLETDFEVGPGPAYHVYLVAEGGIRNEAQFKNASSVDLGRLRAFQGSQRYAIPDGVDPARYKSVVVWCQRFGVLITPADLSR